VRPSPQPSGGPARSGAALLDSRRTAERDWTFARTWLLGRLGPRDEPTWALGSGTHQEIVADSWPRRSMIRKYGPVAEAPMDSPRLKTVFTDAFVR
jgi:hypothetical protein